MSYLRRDLLMFFAFMALVIPPTCYVAIVYFAGIGRIAALVALLLLTPLFLPGIVFHARVCDDATGIEGYLALHHPEHLSQRGKWYRRAYFIWVWAIISVYALTCLVMLLLANVVGREGLAMPR